MHHLGWIENQIKTNIFYQIFRIPGSQWAKTCTSILLLFACIAKGYHCGGEPHCPDSSDELPQHCNCKDANMFTCDNGSCIREENVCTGIDLCGDGSDRKYNVCHGKCFIQYPNWEDPFRKSCFSKEKFNHIPVWFSGTLSRFFRWNKLLMN